MGFAITLEGVALIAVGFATGLLIAVLGATFVGITFFTVGLAAGLLIAVLGAILVGIAFFAVGLAIGLLIAVLGAALVGIAFFTVGLAIGLLIAVGLVVTAGLLIAVLGAALVGIALFTVGFAAGLLIAVLGAIGFLESTRWLLAIGLTLGVVLGKGKLLCMLMVIGATDEGLAFLCLGFPPALLTVLLVPDLGLTL